MSPTKAAAGSSAVHDPRHTACATRSPARPTYMGLRLRALLPVVTRTDARSGCIGSTVVPLRANWRPATPASVPDASETIAVAAARVGLGLRLGAVRSR